MKTISVIKNLLTELNQEKYLFIFQVKLLNDTNPFTFYQPSCINALQFFIHVIEKIYMHHLIRGSAVPPLNQIFFALALDFVIVVFVDLITRSDQVVSPTKKCPTHFCYH